jgi:hypothetical protein
MTDRWRTLNQAALVIAVLVLATLGLAWWRDRARTFEAPRFDPARFVALTEGEPLAGRERWLVAVNLDCPHCQQHLRALAGRIATRDRAPALGAILVDQPSRPASLDLGTRLPGGVWWDSAQVWRTAWGRRAYGETFRFDAEGRMLSSTPVGIVPDSAGTPM